MSSKTTVSDQLEREAQLEWVPLDLIRVNEHVQRGLNWAWVKRIAAEFKLEDMGSPVVNHRDGVYHVIGGQHRVAALKLWLGDGNWEKQTAECWTYKELSDEEEAEKFLRLNARLKPNTFDEFKVAVQAGRDPEAEISRLVGETGLIISRTGGGISATGTLVRVYKRGGTEVLVRTLLIIMNAYGEAGFEAAVIDGISLVIQRYAAEIDDAKVTGKLGRASGGASGLLNKSNQLRLSTGSNKSQCVAAAVVEIVNRGAGGRKLPSWWKQ